MVHLPRGVLTLVRLDKNSASIGLPYHVLCTLLYQIAQSQLHQVFWTDSRFLLMLLHNGWVYFASLLASTIGFSAETSTTAIRFPFLATRFDYSPGSPIGKS